MARPVSRGSSPRASVREEFTDAIVSAGMRGSRRSYSAALPGARRHDMPPPRLDSRFGSRRRENSPGRKYLRRSLRFSIREAQRLLALLPPFPVVKLAEKVCERKEYAEH